MVAPMEPTPRTRLGRGRKRAVDDRERLHRFLREALVAHLAVSLDSHPVVLPVAFAVDPDGPDEAGSLYVHGSVAARWLGSVAVAPAVCVTVTEVDGLVAARSAVHHSMNYRSAVVIGRARQVEDVIEKQRALDLIIDHVIPGRSATLRPSTRKELLATSVLAIPMVEASMKERAGGPSDEPEDVAEGAWGGHIPLRAVSSGAVSDAHAENVEVPIHVLERAASFL